jgi:hypothetical protein
MSQIREWRWQQWQQRMQVRHWQWQQRMQQLECSSYAPLSFVPLVPAATSDRTGKPVEGVPPELLPVLAKHIQPAESDCLEQLAGSSQEEHAPRVTKRLLKSQIKQAAKKQRQGRGGAWGVLPRCAHLL